MRSRSPRAYPGRNGTSRLARAGDRLLSPLYLDLGGDHRDAVFVAGSGRGGTTWLADSIGRLDHGYRRMFEPFHPGKVRLARPFGYRRYLRPGDPHPGLRERAGSILSGQTRGQWTDSIHSRFIFRRRLIKEIRANLFLGWLAANFPEMPLVFLLRHPCAVALSRTRLGWHSRLEEFVEQPELVEDFLSPALQLTRSLPTEFERHVFAWCVENLVPLTQLGLGQAHLVFYEGLCVTPEEELRSLFEYLGRSVDVSPETLESHSVLSRPGVAACSEEHPVGGWQKALGQDQTRRALEILARFGLDSIYGDSPMPDTRAARELLEGST